MAPKFEFSGKQKAYLEEKFLKQAGEASYKVAYQRATQAVEKFSKKFNLDTAEFFKSEENMTIFLDRLAELGSKFGRGRAPNFEVSDKEVNEKVRDLIAEFKAAEDNLLERVAANSTSILKVLNNTHLTGENSETLYQRLRELSEGQIGHANKNKIFALLAHYHSHLSGHGPAAAEYFSKITNAADIPEELNWSPSGLSRLMLNLNQPSGWEILAKRKEIAEMPNETMQHILAQLFLQKVSRENKQEVSKIRYVAAEALGRFPVFESVMKKTNEKLFAAIAKNWNQEHHEQLIKRWVKEQDIFDLTKTRIYEPETFADLTEEVDVSDTDLVKEVKAEDAKTKLIHKKISHNVFEKLQSFATSANKTKSLQELEIVAKQKPVKESRKDLLKKILSDQQQNKEVEKQGEHVFDQIDIDLDEQKQQVSETKATSETSSPESIVQTAFDMSIIEGLKAVHLASIGNANAIIALQKANDELETANKYLEEDDRTQLTDVMQYLVDDEYVELSPDIFAVWLAGVDLNNNNEVSLFQKLFTTFNPCQSENDYAVFAKTCLKFTTNKDRLAEKLALLPSETLSILLAKPEFSAPEFAKLLATIRLTEASQISLIKHAKDVLFKQVAEQKDGAKTSEASALISSLFSNQEIVKRLIGPRFADGLEIILMADKLHPDIVEAALLKILMDQSITSQMEVNARLIYSAILIARGEKYGEEAEKSIAALAQISKKTSELSTNSFITLMTILYRQEDKAELSEKFENKLAAIYLRSEKDWQDFYAILIKEANFDKTQVKSLLLQNKNRLLQYRALMNILFEYEFDAEDYDFIVGQVDTSMLMEISQSDNQLASQQASHLLHYVQLLTPPNNLSEILQSEPDFFTKLSSAQFSKVLATNVRTLLPNGKALLDDVLISIKEKDQRYPVSSLDELVTVVIGKSFSINEPAHMSVLDTLLKTFGLETTEKLLQRYDLDQEVFLFNYLPNLPAIVTVEDKQTHEAFAKRILSLLKEKVRNGYTIPTTLFENDSLTKLALLDPQGIRELQQLAFKHLAEHYAVRPEHQAYMYLLTSTQIRNLLREWKESAKLRALIADVANGNPDVLQEWQDTQAEGRSVSPQTSRSEAEVIEWLLANFKEEKSYSNIQTFLSAQTFVRDLIKYSNPGEQAELLLPARQREALLAVGLQNPDATLARELFAEACQNPAWVLKQSEAFLTNTLANQESNSFLQLMELGLTLDANSKDTKQAVEKREQLINLFTSELETVAVKAELDKSGYFHPSTVDALMRVYSSPESRANFVNLLKSPAYRDYGDFLNMLADPRLNSLMEQIFSSGKGLDEIRKDLAKMVEDSELSDNDANVMLYLYADDWMVKQVNQLFTASANSLAKIYQREIFFNRINIDKLIELLEESEDINSALDKWLASIETRDFERLTQELEIAELPILKKALMAARSSEDLPKGLQNWLISEAKKLDDYKEKIAKSADFLLIQLASYKPDDVANNATRLHELAVFIPSEYLLNVPYKSASLAKLIAGYADAVGYKKDPGLTSGLFALIQELLLNEEGQIINFLNGLQNENGITVLKAFVSHCIVQKDNVFLKEALYNLLSYASTNSPQLLNELLSSIDPSSLIDVHELHHVLNGLRYQVVTNKNSENANLYLRILRQQFLFDPARLATEKDLLEVLNTEHDAAKADQKSAEKLFNQAKALMESIEQLRQQQKERGDDQPALAGEIEMQEVALAMIRRIPSINSQMRSLDKMLNTDALEEVRRFVFGIKEVYDSVAANETKSEQEQKEKSKQNLLNAIIEGLSTEGDNVVKALLEREAKYNLRSSKAFYHDKGQQNVSIEHGVIKYDNVKPERGMAVYSADDREIIGYVQLSQEIEEGKDIEVKEEYYVQNIFDGKFVRDLLFFATTADLQSLPEETVNRLFARIMDYNELRLFLNQIEQAPKERQNLLVDRFVGYLTSKTPEFLTPLDQACIYKLPGMNYDKLHSVIHAYHNIENPNQKVIAVGLLNLVINNIIEGQTNLFKTESDLELFVKDMCDVVPDIEPTEVVEKFVNMLPNKTLTHISSLATAYFKHNKPLIAEAFISVAMKDKTLAVGIIKDAKSKADFLALIANADLNTLKEWLEDKEVSKEIKSLIALQMLTNKNYLEEIFGFKSKEEKGEHFEAVSLDVINVSIFKYIDFSTIPAELLTQLPEPICVRVLKTQEVSANLTSAQIAALFSKVEYKKALIDFVFSRFHYMPKDYINLLANLAEDKAFRSEIIKRIASFDKEHIVAFLAVAFRGLKPAELDELLGKLTHNIDNNLKTKILLQVLCTDNQLLVGNQNLGGSNLENDAQLISSIQKKIWDSKNIGSWIVQGLKGQLPGFNLDNIKLSLSGLKILVNEIKKNKDEQEFFSNLNFYKMIIKQPELLSECTKIPGFVPELAAKAAGELGHFAYFYEQPGKFNDAAVREFPRFYRAWITTTIPEVKQRQQEDAAHLKAPLTHFSKQHPAEYTDFAVKVTANKSSADPTKDYPTVLVTNHLFNDFNRVKALFGYNRLTRNMVVNNYAKLTQSRTEAEWSGYFKDTLGGNPRGVKKLAYILKENSPADSALNHHATFAFNEAERVYEEQRDNKIRNKGWKFLGNPGLLSYLGVKMKDAWRGIKSAFSSEQAEPQMVYNYVTPEQAGVQVESSVVKQASIDSKYKSKVGSIAVAVARLDQSVEHKLHEEKPTDLFSEEKLQAKMFDDFVKFSQTDKFNIIDLPSDDATPENKEALSKIVDDQIDKFIRNYPGQKPADLEKVKVKCREHYDNMREISKNLHLADLSKEIRERAKAMSEINAEVIKIKEMFNDVALLVEQQGLMLNLCEEFIARANEECKQALTYLEKAEAKQISELGDTFSDNVAKKLKDLRDWTMFLWSAAGLVATPMPVIPTSVNEALTSATWISNLQGFLGGLVPQDIEKRLKDGVAGLYDIPTDAADLVLDVLNKRDLGNEDKPWERSPKVTKLLEEYKNLAAEIKARQEHRKEEVAGAEHKPHV